MIDNQKIFEARREIKRTFDELPIFKRSRQAALYSFCAVLEVQSFLAEADPDAVFQAGRNAVEATIQAIPAVLDRCPPGVENDLTIHRRTYEEAYELFQFAKSLEKIDYCFKRADREQFNVHLNYHSGAIVFEYASEQEAAADAHIRSGELSRRIIPATEQQQLEILEIALAASEELRRTIMFTGTESITYDMTPSLKLIAARWAGVLSNAEEWYLPDSFRIDTRTVGEIRKFWGAVQSIVNLHDVAHRLVAEPDILAWPIGSAVHMRRAPTWATLIADISSLSLDKALELLSWYTFDRRAAETTPLIQPFIEVFPGHLVLPTTSSTTTAKERNLIKLLKRHPTLRKSAEQLKRHKEALALDDVSRFFPSTDFVTERTVVIEGITDADLLVYEKRSGFVLVIQHKWLTEPDTLNESNSNDEELSNGIRQAHQSCNALRANQGLVRRALKLKESDPMGPIEVIVISRGAEPTGFLSQAEIPVVEEEAFRSLLDKHRGLRALLAALRFRPDHVEASKLYRDTTAELEIAGYTFKIPVLAK